MLKWLKVANEERSQKNQLNKETGRQNSNESGNREESANKIHDSKQIAQSAEAEENDSLISETLGEIPDRMPTSI